MQKGQDGLLEEASLALQELLREQLQEISEDRSQACCDQPRMYPGGSDRTS
jgi:hypothetical protein